MTESVQQYKVFNPIHYQVILTQMQEATVKYLQGQAHFKNSQINDALECYRKSLKLLGESWDSFISIIDVVSHIFDCYFKLNSLCSTDFG